jgi:hypothetical protein
MTLAVISIFLVFSGCDKPDVPVDPDMSPFASFHDIPGITTEEIAAIEDLRQKYESFSYGMTLSTESFIKEDNDIGGYSALFCE